MERRSNRHTTTTAIGVRLAVPGAIAFFAVSTTLPAAYAQDSRAESAAASRASLAASGMILAGSAGVVRAGAQLVVASVRPVANASVVVLRDAATAPHDVMRTTAMRAGALAPHRRIRP